MKAENFKDALKLSPDFHTTCAHKFSHWGWDEMAISFLCNYKDLGSSIRTLGQGQERLKPGAREVQHEGRRGSLARQPGVIFKLRGNKKTSLKIQRWTTP